MAKRHTKMYKDSPEMKRDEESGKMAVKKKSPTEAEKASSEVSSGTAGMQQHEGHMQELEHKHSKERMELFHKHEKEHLALMHKGMKAGPSESKGDGDGQEKINKVEAGE